MENKTTDFLSDKRLPASTDAEQAVLGGILIDPESISKTIGHITKDSFYIIKHQQIFECMLELYNLSQPIEGLLLVEKMKENGYYGGDDDKKYILTLAETASSIGNISYYVNIIEEKFKLRSIIDICGKVSDLCYDNSDFDEVIDYAEQRIYDLRNGNASDRMRKLESVVREEMDYLKELASDESGKFEPIKVGISSIDNFLGGLNKGNLIILAARPGVGKTSFALNIAYNIASSSRYEPKKSIAFFSLEMSNSELSKRIISSTLSINSENLRLGTLKDDEWDDIYDFWHDTLPNVNFIMDDTPAISVLDIKSKVRKIKNLGLVVIDYLQLMNSAKKTESRVQEISELTRSLKLMAKEIDVPVILLSQLSRSVEKDDRAPRLSDLRDSGSIEQDADIVMFLSRPMGADTEAKNQNVCDVLIEKNRHGKTGKVTLQWDGSHTSFKAISYEPIPENMG